MLVSNCPSIYRPLSFVVLRAVLLVYAFWANSVWTRAVAEDLTNLGGDLSSDLPGRHAIQVAAPNITTQERVAMQAAGFPLFHRVAGVAEGLGPSFVNSSCGGCHIDNGRGPARFGAPSMGGDTMVVKVKRRGVLADGGTPPVRGIGTQICPHAVGRGSDLRIRLTWRTVHGQYADGSAYQLRRPVLRFPKGISLPRGTIVSLRMTPILIGTGLIEAIPASAILAASDPMDANRDGISGRVNWVRDISSDRYVVGRFGFKATEPTVLQQTAAALYNDMQITNSFFNDGRTPFEARFDTLHSLAIYLRLSGVPKATFQSNVSVVRGKRIFSVLACDGCHRMTVVTGENTDRELANQTIHPFSDLLLHDMGSGLADGWNEFSANGREWRTTPLWGIGFSNRLARGKAIYLHDGRARTLEEAILWHGGEAESSKRYFTRLKRSEREDLLKFLSSL